MPQIPTNQSRECRQDVDIYADIDFCRGKASKPGIKPFILAIRKSHITSFPKPGGSAASSMDEFAIITESFTLESGSGFHRTELVPKLNSIGGESQGEWPAKSFQNTCVATMGGSGKEATGYASSLNNDDMIFLVPTKDRGFRLIGNADDHVDVAVSQQSGQAPGDQNQTQLTLTVTDDFLPPFYHGNIKLIDGTTISGETGEVIS